MHYKTVVLVDGENLVFRYQNLLKNGKKPQSSVEHVENCFVWENDILAEDANDIVRVSYYTTVVGDDKKLEDLTKKISEAKYNFTTLSGAEYAGTLVPHVYKKGRSSTKTKSVDINLTIDALRYAYGTTIDKIIIISGDGDYIPLLREIMSRGKAIQVYALSDGLNKNIICNVDDLVLIDEILFVEPRDETTRVE